MADHRTSLGRARGAGSAKTGVSRFIGERVSGVALIVLCLWAVMAALSLASGGYDAARLWLTAPANATLLILLALVSFYHMRLGMNVVIEDYIERPITKAILVMANTFACGGGAVLTLVCILKVAFGGGAS